MYLMGSNGLPPITQPHAENWLGLESVVGLGLACGLVLRLGLVSGLYKWLFYLATVRQLNHVVHL